VTKVKVHLASGCPEQPTHWHSLATPSVVSCSLVVEHNQRREFQRERDNLHLAPAFGHLTFDSWQGLSSGRLLFEPVLCRVKAVKRFLMRPNVWPKPLYLSRIPSTVVNLFSAVFTCFLAWLLHNR
jgi:hypothetical protein